MKRRLILSLTLIVIVSLLLAACTSGRPSGNGEPGASQQTGNESSSESGTDVVTSAGTLPIVNEKITLKVMTGLDWRVTDLEDNYVTKWMEEKTNIHIEWQPVQWADLDQKMNVMLASGTDIPDIIMNGVNSRNQQFQYGSQGLFIPLEDLYEQYGYYSKQALEYDPTARQQLTSPDDHLYSVFMYEDAYQANFLQKLWINQTWLTRLGLDMPTTTEQLYQVLKAFKEDDPNGNGLQDEIPLSGNKFWPSEGFLMSAFIPLDLAHRLNLVNGKVVPAFTQPEYKEGLKYINRLYNEGLFDKESFVMDGSMLSQLVMGEHNVLGAFPEIVPGAAAPDDSEQSRSYTAVPPLKGPNGVVSASYNPSRPMEWQNGLIFKNSKYPEAAFRWLDFMNSEEAFWVARYGEEGVDWERAGPNDVGIDGQPAKIKLLSNVTNGTQTNKIWGYMAPMIETSALSNGVAVAPDDEWNMNARLYNETKKYDGHQPAEIIPPFLHIAPESADKHAGYKTAINTYVKESYAKFVTGELDIDRDWDAFLNELNRIGLDDYVAIVQQAIDSSK